MQNKAQASADIGPFATILLSLAIGTTGVGMFLTPGANVGLDVSDQRLGLKQLVVWMWGRPAGIVLIGMSALILAGVIAVSLEKRASNTAS